MAEPRTSGHTLTRRVRSCAGTLILVPILVLFLGTDWRIHSDVELALDVRVDGLQSTPSELASLPAASRSEESVTVERASHVLLALPMAVEEFTLTLQADHDDRYRISASADGNRFEDLSTILEVEDAEGLQMRGPILFALREPIRFLRLHPLGDDEPYVVSGISLEKITRVHPLYVVPPLLWISWLLVYAAERRSGPGSLPRRILAAWGRFDVWLASALTYLVLFRVPPLVAAFGLAALATYLLVRWAAGHIQTAPLRYAVGIPAALLLGIVVLRGGLELFVRTVVGRAYDLTVDHRMRPDQDEINEDGIRFRGTAAEIEDSDYVVLFLGDSFTQGVLLGYEEAYPYVFEQLATAGTCSQRLRAVNFGWTSSSPLLSFRLLQDIGQWYKPDLVVCSLDMTDFHDDLRYEILLRQGGDFEIDTTKLLETLASLSGLAAFRDTELGQGLAQLIRKVDRLHPNAGLNLPADRFFITSQPLEQTREQIERGVMRNLGSMNQYAEDVLDSRMVLVIYPRGYQYSARESPDNSEAERYQTLGPHAQEPFRYFRELQTQLPYAVFSLLPAFVESTEFPLFIRDDPHWNRSGARLAAEHVSTWLAERGLIPCALSPRWGSERSANQQNWRGIDLRRNRRLRSNESPFLVHPRLSAELSPPTFNTFRSEFSPWKVSQP